MTVARPISSAQDFVFDKGAAGDAELTVLGGLDDQRGVVACGQYLLDTPPGRRRIRHAIIPISGCTGLVEVVGEAR